MDNANIPPGAKGPGPDQQAPRPVPPQVGGDVSPEHRIPNQYNINNATPTEPKSTTDISGGPNIWKPTVLQQLEQDLEHFTQPTDTDVQRAITDYFLDSYDKGTKAEQIRRSRAATVLRHAGLGQVARILRANLYSIPPSTSSS